MATSFWLRRFSNPAILKAIEPGNLLRLLLPFEPFFAGRGMPLPAAGEDLACDRLAGILMSPGGDTPEELLDALFFIDEMTDDVLFDDIHTRAAEVGIDLAGSDEMSPADLAVRIWLARPELLEQLHAEQFLSKAKRFESFFATSELPPVLAPPDEVAIRALEHDLNDWFDTRRKGRGTRVFPFFREDGTWFLVRHGQRFKREGTVQTNGGSGRIFYRPERFDVLVYRPEQAELAIHTETKGEQHAYCRSFGKHLFGDPHFFELHASHSKFTLRPLMELGPGALNCRDVRGLVEIALTELQVRHDCDQKHLEVHRADDVLRALAESGREIPPNAEPILAAFRVRFVGALRPRTVRIRIPNGASFDRESDSDIIHEWLQRRGFISERGEAGHVGHGETLALFGIPTQPGGCDGRVAGATR